MNDALKTVVVEKKMPFYTRCIQPHNIDPKLFTDREEEYRHLKEVLKSIILAKEEEERRLLIHGDRGMGKSILLRKVLSHLKQEIEFIPVIVDGRYSMDAEELLRDMCEKLASLLRNDVDYKKEEKTISEISYLNEVSRVAVITKSWARSSASEIEAKRGAGIGFLDFFKLSFGVGGKEAEELTKSITTEINSLFLNPKNLLDDLKGFVFALYNVELDKTSPICKFFLDQDNPFLAKETILAQSNEDDYEMMVENGILVPDDLYEPRKYRLSPDLSFLR
jgi:energy-coupling factor transporter ATP-binding protein EcfA2